jgi:putative acyl-CoA dehydrogenase
MTNVLADLALETEAALWLALRLAHACEADAGDEARAAARIVTPAAKYWVCKRAIAVAAEAMEALGGNGYVEENPLPRFYREAPVNSIWEGSGNVVCLDVARAARKEPDAVDALLAELAAVRGANASLDRHVVALAPLLRGVADDPATARRVAQWVALAVSAAELVRHAPDFVADAYCAARLTPDICAGAAFGSLSRAADAKRIVERAVV